MTTQAQRDTVADIIRDMVVAKFGDAFVLNEIIVRDTVDIVDGMEYLRVKIIFEGDRKLMTPKWRIGMKRHTRRKMAEQDIWEFPVISFVEKADWEAIQAGEYYESA
jgi:hypothetical protein